MSLRIVTNQQVSSTVLDKNIPEAKLKDSRRQDRGKNYTEST